MAKLDEFIAEFASFVWGLPLLILLTGGGLFLLIYEYPHSTLRTNKKWNEIN